MKTGLSLRTVQGDETTGEFETLNPEQCVVLILEIASSTVSSLDAEPQVLHIQPQARDLMMVVPMLVCALNEYVVPPRGGDGRSRTSQTPVSTVSRSCTLREGKGNELANWVGKSCIHVSSPTKARRRPPAASWSMRLSSVTAAAEKLEPTSMNVGKPPCSGQQYEVTP